MCQARLHQRRARAVLLLLTACTTAAFAVVALTSTAPPRPPSPLRPRQVVSWLLSQRVSTLVVGHQPHGDAPVLMRCAAPDGTSGELIVVTADTSFSGGAAGRNCHGRRA